MAANESIEDSVITNRGVDLANQVLKEVNRPMSIDEIRGKFQVEFPFDIKIVTTPKKSAFSIGQIFTVTGYALDDPFYQYEKSENKRKYDYVLMMDGEEYWTPCDKKMWALAIKA